MTDERLRELYQNAVAARTAGSRTECPPPEQLHALARREGTEESRLRTLDHVMTCGECMRELELLRVIEKAGTRLSASDAPARLRTSGSWRRIVPLALAATLVLAVSLVVRERRNSDVADEPMRGADSTIVLRTTSDVELDARDSLVVAWQPVPGATRYVVEVLDDGGRAALSEATAETTLVVRGLDRLTPGRDYRWWVRASDASGVQRSSALGRLRMRNR